MFSQENALLRETRVVLGYDPILEKDAGRFWDGNHRGRRISSEIHYRL